MKGLTLPHFLLAAALSATDASSCQGLEQDIDYGGNDLQPVKAIVVETADACCDACMSNAACRFWTWHGDQNFCYLKASDAGRRSYSQAVSGSGGCSTDEHCSLGGICQADGQCKCDAAWTGPTCSQLNLVPAALVDMYDREPSTSSWGGNVVYSEEDGLWHLFFAEFLNECPLGSWESNSVVAHATAESHEGPFTRLPGVVQEPFHHNPSVIRAPDGTFLLYSIGNGSMTPKDCRGGASLRPLGDAPQAGIITLSYSASVHGPWTTLAEPVLEGQDGEWDAFVTNPSAYIFENGTVLLSYRGGWSPWHVGMAVADSWRGPYRRASGEPLFPDINEDPGIFRDARGHFHMLTHYFTTTGGHAFSRDGLSWTFVGSAYSHEISLANGTAMTVRRRERPQVLVLDGEPAFVYTGVLPESGPSYTFGQAIHRKGSGAIVV